MSISSDEAWERLTGIATTDAAKIQLMRSHIEYVEARSAAAERRLLILAEEAQRVATMAIRLHAGFADWNQNTKFKP